MKILHTSDWHLGQHFMGKSRRDEHAAFIAWLLALIERESVHAVIVAGDVFDTGSPPSYAREMYHQLVLDLKAVNCQLVIVGGNHDSVSMLNESKSLLSYLGTHVLAQAQPDDLESHVIPLLDPGQETAAWLCAIPYLRPRDVMKSIQGQSEQEKKHELMTQIGDFYQSVYEVAKAKNTTLRSPVPIIGTGHLTAMGGQISESVRDLYVGTLEALPTSVFPAFDYLALGHIHRAQAISQDGKFRYSGSPIPLSFDELSREKSLVIIDTEALAERAMARDLFSDDDQPIKIESIPRFQSMQSLAGSLEEVFQAIEQLDLAREKEQGKTLWLEVTVLADDYLSDVQKRLMEAIVDKPIELLRVMRKRSDALSDSAFEQRQTLSELSVADVFEQSLKANMSLEEEDSQQLTALFQRCLLEMEEDKEAEA
ncbi:exonuclease subunit SbcD [Marinomonas pollencensis]|uniref:Nuclease SbcCD subunit D n=1 Tax=Marinomonas pollencensis TaxID=491954 RepID=A0A3E0DA33_9GAMM|nr:exonuclease subunit SbcD [Marinomonas pollencensis]REG79424.1 exodeoxyribonuclease I subunit D [Marinomonas pollencensis]